MTPLRQRMLEDMRIRSGARRWRSSRATAPLWPLTHQAPRIAQAPGPETARCNFVAQGVCLVPSCPPIFYVDTIFDHNGSGINMPRLDAYIESAIIKS